MLLVLLLGCCHAWHEHVGMRQRQPWCHLLLWLLLLERHEAPWPLHADLGCLLLLLLWLLVLAAEAGCLQLLAWLRWQLRLLLLALQEAASADGWWQ
jgi:hypothetical protein